MARQLRIRSIKGPVILFVIALVLVVALAVLWNVVLTYDYQRLKSLVSGEGSFHVAFIVLGSVLFVLAIVLLSVLGSQLFSQIRFSQRLTASIATFTHELKSPLASIKMFAQTLLRPGIETGEREKFLRLILVDVERLSRQISNVLDAAQLDSLQGLQIAPVWTDLQGFLGEYVQGKLPYLVHAARDTRLELQPGPAVAVLIDPHAFRSVLDNLVDNAVKYARGAGGLRIAITSRRGERPDRVVIEVADDGTGIAAEDLPRMFQRFGRIETSQESPRRRGTGLGLWIVDSIVTAHEGKVAARSPGLGQGTTISIEVPCGALEEGAEPLEAASTPAAPEASSAAPRGEGQPG